mgnify:CR=1 FL=1
MPESRTVAPRGATKFVVTLLDAVRVCVAYPRAEQLRFRPGPAVALSAARSEGARRAARDAFGQRRLRRMIAVVDRFAPGGPNCYRRVLWESLLDPAAAATPVIFGLDANASAGSGHVWFEGRESPSPERYAARFSL